MGEITLRATCSIYDTSHSFLNGVEVTPNVYYAAMRALTGGSMYPASWEGSDCSVPGNVVDGTVSPVIDTPERLLEAPYPGGVKKG